MKGKQEKTATHIGAGDGGAPYLSSSVNRSDTSSKPKLCHHQHRNQWGTLTALFVYLYSVQIIDFSQISLLPIFLYLLFLRGDSDSSDHESDFQNSRFDLFIFCLRIVLGIIYIRLFVKYCEIVNFLVMKYINLSWKTNVFLENFYDVLVFC